MKQISSIFLIGVFAFLIACEKNESPVPQEASFEAFLQRLEQLENLNELEGRSLSQDELVKLDKKLSELKLVKKDAPTPQRVAICGGLVHYPDGTGSAPCLVRHKITYLDDKYDEYNGDDFFFTYFEFELDCPGCTQVVYGAPDLYNYEFTLPTGGNHTMNLYFYGFTWDPVTFQVYTTRKRVCQKTYSCD